jgi:hypothetical protein
MKSYWTTTKPDGTPITDGRLCKVYDAEDGTIPVRVYGRTREEIESKVDRTLMTAQSTLVRERESRNGNGNGQKPLAFGPVSADPPRDPRILSPDETMRLTAELNDPAKSANASYRLTESERAKRSQAQEQYLAVCRAFPGRHPDFFNHKTNRTLLINKALLTVGQDISLITAEVLDQCYADLVSADALLTEEEVREQPPANPEDEPSAVHPGGNPGPVPVRPANGVVSSTSHRSNRLGSPATPPWKPKLTLQEIGKLSTKDTEAILHGAHPRITKKDYEEACDYYWPPRAQASA